LDVGVFQPSRKGSPQGVRVEPLVVGDIGVDAAVDACEPNNPYENDAAKRAAPLGLELGAAAEKNGDLRHAFELYEAGGHFALADRVFMMMTRAEQDEPSKVSSTRSSASAMPGTSSSCANKCS
jgi:hypothetical protein